MQMDGKCKLQFWNVANTMVQILAPTCCNTNLITSLDVHMLQTTRSKHAADTCGREMQGPNTIPISDGSKMYIITNPCHLTWNNLKQHEKTWKTWNDLKKHEATRKNTYFVKTYNKLAIKCRWDEPNYNVATNCGPAPGETRRSVLGFPIFYHQENIQKKYATNMDCWHAADI